MIFRLNYKIAIHIFYMCCLLFTQLTAQSYEPKGNLNNQYINKKALTLSKLDDSYFTNGCIIKHKDTITCKIYLPKHKINEDMYLYIITKGLNDSVSILTAKDMDGYMINGIYMKAHISVTSRDTSYFFMKLIQTGKVALYQRVSIPNDNEFLYYFQKSGTNDLFFLAPYKQNYIYIQEKFKDGGMVSKYNSQNEDQFRIAFCEYLKDCTSIRNKIAVKFYTMNDIETIIKEYNNCGL